MAPISVTESLYGVSVYYGLQWVKLYKVTGSPRVAVITSTCVPTLNEQFSGVWFPPCKAIHNKNLIITKTNVLRTYLIICSSSEVLMHTTLCVCVSTYECFVAILATDTLFSHSANCAGTVYVPICSVCLPIILLYICNYISPFIVTRSSYPTQDSSYYWDFFSILTILRISFFPPTSWLYLCPRHMLHDFSILIITLL